jgi:hypothetical protein
METEFVALTFAVVTRHAGLAFQVGFGYRDSESYRILSEGFGLWMCPAGVQPLAGLCFYVDYILKNNYTAVNINL